MLAKMQQYVESLFAGREFGTSRTVYFFRSRLLHTLRVTAWARRLLDALPPQSPMNRQAVLAAALFHDAGYTLAPDGEGHAALSRGIFEAYAAEQCLDPAFAAQVAEIIGRHSDKHLLPVAGTPLEWVLLMEADLLDETGALSLVWDVFVTAQRKEAGYLDAYRHMTEYTCRELSENPLVTEAGRGFWAEKQRLVQAFMASLERDLAVGEDLL